jgi:hypothetical protein
VREHHFLLYFLASVQSFARRRGANSGVAGMDIKHFLASLLIAGTRRGEVHPRPLIGKHHDYLR